LIGRIRTRDEFIRLRRDGRRLRIDPLWCTHLLDPSIEAAHVAFAISRSVGNAVTRNRIRRRLRAVLSTMDLPNGLYLIGCRPAVAELTFDQMAILLLRLPARLP
jgi:ribonuclease P protein component